MRKANLRRLRAGLTGLVGVAFLVVAVAMIGRDALTNSTLASIVSAFVGLAALAASLVVIAPPPGPPASDADLAADLAATVAAEWRDEAGARKLRDPKVLPLTWTSGRLTGPFDEATRQLAQEFRSVRAGRLVVLGEPGSGKTVLAMLLTLGLIADREPTAPVPVLLSASSWDPVRESLEDWLTHYLAGAYYNGDTAIPRTLWARGLVLPVLDGLDEIPEVARRHAVHRVNAAVGAERPVVVTCREAEYDDLIAAGSPALRRAPVQRMAPIAVDDVIDHLDAVPDWPPGLSWTAIHEELRHAPDGPVAAALSTPLMISMTRSAYRQGGDPAELLDTSRFPTRHAVEDHLVDRAIDAAYEPDTAGKGRKWLAFLARYLHDHRERDLAWWRLADRLVSPWVAPMLGIVIGLGMVVVAGGVAVLTGFDKSEEAVGVAAISGVTVALLTTALWFGATGREPRRMGVVRQGSARRLRRGFRTGAAFVLIPGVPVLVLGAIAGLVVGDLGFEIMRDFVWFAAVVVAVVFVVGCAVAAHHWLDAIPERSARATPLGFLRQDRRAALVGAAVTGALAAVLTWPALAVATFVGEVLGQGLAGWAGKSGSTGVAGLTERLQLDGTAQTVGALVVLPFLAMAVLVLLTRAWPRFVLARAVLAVSGRLPWRLLAFLSDARDRGLLRQSGGAYQFRHVRLQQRLALPAEQRPAPAVAPPRRRRTGVVVIVVALLATGVVTLTGFNHLRCMPAFSLADGTDQQREYVGDRQHCLGVVPRSTENGLAEKYDVVRRLSEANEKAEDLTIAALLPLDGPLSTETLAVLDGVALAQEESARLGNPVRVRLVNTGDRNPERQSIALERLRATGEPIHGVVTSVPWEWPTGEPPPVFGPADEPHRAWALRIPTMIDYADTELAAEEVLTVAYFRSECAEYENVVSLVEARAAVAPQNLDSLACRRNPAVITDDDTLADRLVTESDPKRFRDLRLYYPVARPSRARPYPSGDSATSANAYQATLNAAGISDFAIHRLTATPEGWRSEVVRA